MLKWILRVLAGMIAFVVIVGAAGLGYRAWRQHENAQFLEINTPNGIVQAGYVRLGGVEQWIQIRGEDRANPVVLVLHGGPANSLIPFTYRQHRAWERDFTIVHWDQRGAGRTLLHDRSVSTDSIERYVDEGIELADYLRRTLGKDRIILVGLSWGSVLGPEIARRRPDLLYAYVGAGQVIDMQQNEAIAFRLLLERVRAAGADRDVAELERIGAPPYADRAELMAERKVLRRHRPPAERNRVLENFISLAFAPGYAMGDWEAVAYGKHSDALFDELMQYRVVSDTYDVPMFFFQGAEDIQTPTELVVAFEQRIRAPQKEIVLVPGGGHLAMATADQEFLAFLRRRVRPLAVPPAALAAAH